MRPWIWSRFGDGGSLGSPGASLRALGLPTSTASPALRGRPPPSASRLTARSASLHLTTRPNSCPPEAGGPGLHAARNSPTAQVPDWKAMWETTAHRARRSRFQGLARYGFGPACGESTGCQVKESRGPVAVMYGRDDPS
jgi:hypothetical protein